MLKEIIKNKFGTTLLEIMVTVSIFVILMLSAVEIFKAVINGQRNAIAAQNLQESIRYAMETIAKEIRSAKKVGAVCESLFGVLYVIPSYQVYNVFGYDDILYFENKDGVCVSYYLENNRLKIDHSGIADFLTPDELKITNLKFVVADDLIGVSPRTIEPKVTLVMDVEAVGKEMHKQTMKIQTTISARYYE